MFGFLIPLLISVALAVAAYFLKVKPTGTGGQASDLPSVDEGNPIQLGFGTYEVKPQLIYPTSRDTMLKAQSDSGRWTLSWAECYGWGPIATFHTLRWEDDLQVSVDTSFDASRTPYGSVAFNGVGVTDTVTDTDKNGKSTKTEVASKGIMRFWFGIDNQAADPFLVATVAANEASDNQLVPAFRHMAYAVFQQVKVGFSATIPNATIKLTRIPQYPVDETGANGLKSAYAMAGGQANPIHVLAEWATNTKYGAGMGLDEINWPNWNEVAQQCYNENRMISGVLTTADQFLNLQKSILTHIDGVITEQDGQATITLLRGDYTTGSVPVIPNGDITDIELEDADAEQVYNYIGVVYCDEGTNFQQLTIPIYDSANLLATQSSKRTTIELLYFTDPNRARSVGEGKAQALLVPRDAATATVRRRSAYAFEEGDLVRFDRASANLNTNRVWRINQITRSANSVSFAKWTLSEEIGDINHQLTQPPGGGSGGGSGVGSKPIAPLSYELPMELPYAMNPGAEVLVTHLANREDGQFVNFELWQNSGAGYEKVSDDGAFVFAGRSTFPSGGLDIDNVGFIIGSGRLAFDWEEFAADTPALDLAELLALGQLAVLCVNPEADPFAHEIVAFQSITAETFDADTGLPLTFRMKGVVRRLFDTSRITGDAEVFILRNGTVPFIAGPRVDWFNGQTVDFKAVPYSSSARADFDLMSQTALTLKERSRRPYAVDNLAIDGDGSMPRYTETVSARLSWIARSRVVGCGIDDSFANNAAIESGEDFVVRLFNDTGGQIGTDNTVAATQTFADDYGVTRIYFDFTIASGGFAFVTAYVNSRLSTLESIDDLDQQKIVVRRAA